MQGLYQAPPQELQLKEDVAVPKADDDDNEDDECWDEDVDTS